MKRARHTGFVLASLVLAASFVGCPFGKKKRAADEDWSVGVDAATVTVSGTGAKNEGTVLRYANETPLPNVPAVIGKDGTVVRNFPGNGPAVAVVNRGTVVAKVSQYFSTGVLVMFDDPSAGDGSKLLGWVPVTAFDLAAPTPTRIVIVPKADAGAKVQDAGAPVDAGPPPAPPKPGTVAVLPDAKGRCPDKWSLTQGMCRPNCLGTDPKECPRGTTCVAKGGPSKVCSSDH